MKKVKIFHAENDCTNIEFKTKSGYYNFGYLVKKCMDEYSQKNIIGEAYIEIEGKYQWVQLKTEDIGIKHNNEIQIKFLNYRKITRYDGLVYSEGFNDCVWVKEANIFFYNEYKYKRKKEIEQIIKKGLKKCQV